MILKKYNEFINENINEGNFKVYSSMVENGRFKEGVIPKIIKGDFNCTNNKLISLENGPVKVSGDFICHHNELTNLEGCPKEINGDFTCKDNQLTSLKGGPMKVNGDFSCHSNQLTSLEHCPKEINGSLFCDNNIKIEKHFINSGSYKDNYWIDLLDYMIKQHIDFEEYRGWPEGFLNNNLKTSVKSLNKFKL